MTKKSNLDIGQIIQADGYTYREIVLNDTGTKSDLRTTLENYYGPIPRFYKDEGFSVLLHSPPVAQTYGWFVKDFADGWIFFDDKTEADRHVESTAAMMLAGVAGHSAPMQSPLTPVTLTYTNWCGETAERTIIPKAIWYGSTEWHPEPQWMLRAIDTEKGAERDFAFKDFGAPTAVEPVSVPDGWKLVPVDPTEEMVTAYIHPYTENRSLITTIYQTMVAAAPPASTDLRDENERQPILPLTKGMPELRSSLIARVVRQSLKNYGHKCAESVLPECIAGEVDTALRAHEKAWPARDCGPDGGPLLESQDNIGSAYSRAATLSAENAALTERLSKAREALDLVVGSLLFDREDATNLEVLRRVKSAAALAREGN